MHTLKSTRTHPAQYSKNNWISGSLRRHRRLKVRELNDTLTCYLCRGYLINPTTIDNCIHSYCRSCIVQYLQSHNLCPQCKASDGKHISAVNLKSDEILRSLIFKLVPGLYYQERESMLQFSNNSKMSDLTEDDCSELEDEFFSPIEPISLSLEYHPALLTFCCKDEIPPVRYLQCPAGVMIHHLKRFLCSKYDIDPDNPLVEIEIIHEEEVLPNDFTLMDVGYCYNWKRNGPMRFTYRILIHNDMANDVSKTQELDSNTNVCSSQKPEIKQDMSSADAGPQSTGKQVRFTVDHFELSENLEDPLPPPMTYTVFKSKAQESRNLGNKGNLKSSTESELKESLLNDGNGPVKVIIARKPAEIKKNYPKHSSGTEEASYVVTNSDFKSLRSNDLRYSDYTVTSTTSTNSTSKSKQKMEKSAVSDTQKNQISKCDIVVSIPQSQVPGFPKSAEDSITLSQLKTANKKTVPTTPQTFKQKNVPKLKIELSGLKTKISIPKPKSADTGLEPQHKKSKHRKYSMEENGPTSDKVDLETYVKNIGLKPIEVVTAPESLESSGKVKQSPDASPMSSCSSTTSSSNGNFVFSSSAEITSSSHKKRKKKHSRESKDSSGKRRKLHAEISSQPADESLKMKVKLMTPHAHKAHKTESRKASSKNIALPIPAVEDQTSNAVTKNHNESEDDTINTNKNDTLNINISSLNQALSEESLNISNLMIGQKNTSTSDDESLELPSPTDLCQLTDTTDSMTNSKPPLPKPISNIKDTKIPSSPPLPPSLFKTTPLTLTTATSPSLTVAAKQPSTPLPSFVVKPAQKAATKPLSAGQPLSSHPSVGGLKGINSLPKIQNFAVPNPPRSMPSSPKFCSLPTSIASSAHKQIGAQLKRSASLDEAYGANSQAKPNEKFMRKTAYGSVLYSAPIRLNNVAGQKDSSVQKSKSLDKPFYTPISYTLELNKRKSLAASNLPPTSINVSKMSETHSMYNSSASSQAALTITTQSKQPAAQQAGLGPYTSSDKPALEILRITSSQVHSDMKSLPPRSPPKSVRPAHPPIPLLKIKKPGQQSVSTASPPIARSPPTSVTTTTMRSPNVVQSTPPALINMRNTIPLSVVPKANNAKETNAKVESKSMGFTSQDRPPTSLRDFRPMSKDGSVEILDLSASKPHENLKHSHVQTTIGNSLEAALNKIKQNITSCTVADSLQSGKFSVAKTNTEDLLNLQMLSESAISREKIAINPQQKLFEMSKAQQSSVVRQQNASVRNIPNPSALAFRNQQPPLSMLASVVNPLSAQTISSSPSPSSATALPSSAPSSTVTTSDVKTLSPPSLFVNTPKSPNTPNQSSPRTKKHTSIDQVAANLNMRAAAAEAEACAAKAAALEDSTTVSSTSTAAVKKSPPPSTEAVNSSASPIKLIPSPNVSSSDNNAISSAIANNQTANGISATNAENMSQQPSTEQHPTANQTPPKTSFKSIPSLVAPTSSESNSVGNSA